MREPIPYEELEAQQAASAKRAARLGIRPRTSRGRVRDPDKAELLKAAGVPAAMIGPVGPRSFFTAR